MGSALGAMLRTRRAGVRPLVANEMGPMLLVMEEALGRCRGVTVVPNHSQAIRISISGVGDRKANANLAPTAAFG